MIGDIAITSEQENYLKIKDGNYICSVEDSVLYYNPNSLTTILDVIVLYYDPEDRIAKRVIAKYFFSINNRTLTLSELFRALSLVSNRLSYNMSDDEIARECKQLKGQVFGLNVKSKNKNNQVYKDLRLFRA